MILLGEQIVKFKDGTQKTLEEFVAESSGGGGGVGAWENGGSVTDCAFNASKVLPDAMKATIEGNYTDICIVTKCHDATFTYPDCIMTVPFSWFKTYIGKTILFDTSAFSAGNPQGTMPFWFTIAKDGSDYKLTYAGANHFYNQGTHIDVEFYVR